MSEKSEALDFLAEVQNHYILQGGITPLGRMYHYRQKPEPTKESLQSIRNQMIEKGYPKDIYDYESFLKKVESVKSEYSRFEGIHNISMLDSLKNDLKQTFEFSRIAFPENVVIGTSQFGQINAMATAPSNESNIKVIVIDDGLFTFLNGLSKVISMLFEKREEGNDLFSLSYHPDDIDRSLASNELAHERFINLMVSYFCTGHSSNAESYILEYTYNSFAANLRHTAELFILAHEYGHIVSGHFSDETNDEQIIYQDLKLETWQINWAKEMQADRFACMMVMRCNHHLKDMSAEMSFIGIQFLFSTLEMLSIALGYKPSSTHPAPGQRMLRLVESLYGDTPDKELVDDIQSFGSSILYLIHRLWETNRQIINDKINPV